MPPPNDDALRFDHFELQPRERRLLAAGQPVVLGGRAFDLLLALAERPDQLVTRDELLDRVWPDVVVEENNIAVQISSLRKVLGPEAIATVPGRGYRFTRPVQRVGVLPAAAATVPVHAAAVAPDGLPALFGREADLARAQALADRHRVLTLAGPAGVGKSALARALMLCPPCAGHSTWIGLAALADGAALPLRVAEAMRWTLAGDDALAALVRAARQALPAGSAPHWLVLDNAEHLGDAVARVIDALAEVAPLRVLATSQAPLQVADEQLLRLEPLTVPAPAEADAAQALAHGAVALFVDRATAADRRFVLTPERVPAVVHICRQLDGLPLALEMAAARLPLLGLEGLGRSLAQRLRLLAQGPGSTEEPRHRTLQAALDWSYSLLDEPERIALRRCAVFNGGFTLELFAAVAASEAPALDPWQAIDALGGLVARSLVVVDGLDAPRYRLLETVRAYAAQQLQAAGEADATARRHALALRDLFAAERTRVRDGLPVHAAMPRCAPEFDNLGSAIDWCLQQAPALAVELMAHAGVFSVFSPRRRDAERWLAACEPHVDRVAAPELRGEFWLELTRSRVLKADARSADSARRALAIFTAIGHEMGEFQALGALLRGAAGPDPALNEAAERVQQLSARHPEWPDAYRLGAAGMLARWATLNRRFEQALALRREEAQWAAKMANPPMQRAALSNVVDLLGQLGRHEEAVEAGSALLQALRGQHDQANRAYACLFMAASLLALGRLDEATATALEGESVMRTLDLPVMGDLAALIAARRGWPRSAARLAGWSGARYEARQLQPQPEALAQRDEALAFARTRLSATALALELGRGRAMAADEALALLRAEPTD